MDIETMGITYNGTVRSETLRGYIRAKTAEMLANAYKQSMSTADGNGEINSLMQKYIHEEIKKLRYLALCDSRNE
jgi:hypothetical protein